MPWHINRNVFLTIAVISWGNHHGLGGFAGTPVDKPSVHDKRSQNFIRRRIVLLMNTSAQRTGVEGYLVGKLEVTYAFESSSFYQIDGGN